MIKLKLINKLAHHFGLRVRIYRVPSPVPTKKTPLDEIAKLDDKYLSWLAENLEVVTLNNETLSSDPAKRILAIDKGTKILKHVDKWLEAQENAEIAKMRAKIKGYLSSREHIKEDFEDKPKDYPVPTTPTKETPLDEIAKLDDKYLPWLAENLEVVTLNNETLSSDVTKRIPAIDKTRKIIKRVDKWKETQEDAETAKTHAKTKGRLSSRERVGKVTSGSKRIYPVPNPVPTKETPLDEIAKLDDKYLSWLAENLEVVTLNNETLSSEPAKRILAIDKGTKILKRVDKWLEA